MTNIVHRGPKEITRTHRAYNEAYMQAIREGAKSSSDLDIAIREIMEEKGFVLKEEQGHPEFG
jgi:Xaa-Pro aminopeptidase